MALYAPDAVFIGTDAGERWTIDEFEAYAEPHFSAGRGWTYRRTPHHGRGLSVFETALERKTRSLV